MTRVSVLRRRAVVGLAVVVMVVASGCDGGRPAAATVDGHPIATSTLYSFVRTLSASSSAGKKAFAGQSDGTWNTPSVSNVLGFLVKQQFLLDAARARGVTPTAAERTSAKTALLPSFASSSTDSGSKTFDKLPKSLQTYLIDATASQAALQAELGKGIDREADARKVYDADPAAYGIACLSTITVQTQPSLTAVEAALKSGQSFAAVAKRYSVDDFAKAGGVNPCSSLVGFNADIAKELSTGSPTDIKGPFQNSQGAAVFVSVRSRRPGTFAAAESAIVKALPPAGQAQLDAYLAKQEKVSRISIDPRFGTWNPKTGTVDPPAAPAPATGNSGATASEPSATTATTATTAPAG